MADEEVNKSVSADRAYASQLAERIQTRKAAIGVVGLGYVGLPLALALAEGTFRVTGFDVDLAKVMRLGKGESYLAHVSAERIAAATAKGRLNATVDYDVLASMDVIIIAVPTPLTRHREPDMHFVTRTTLEISQRLRRGQLIVLESTTYPGTTEELVLDALQDTGLQVGTDFFLAFSPEREDPGNAMFTTRSVPKVVGGVDATSGALATELYGTIVDQVVSVANARTAEAVKLTENIFRAVNIALVNELKVVYDAMGIDIWDVLDAAATKPFGFMRFDPGPGLGGHCIPIDPFYLTWKAREFGLSTRFIELAGEINVGMPQYVIDKVQSALNDRGIPLKDARVLLLGIAYKKDLDDCRESPAFALLDLLRRRGATIAYHDPLVDALPTTRAWKHLLPMRSTPLTPETLSAQDAVVVATDHTRVDYNLVKRHARIVVDSRGVFREPFPGLIKA